MSHSIALMPPGLLTLLNSKTRKGTRNFKIYQGQRNITLFKMGCSERARGGEYEEILLKLMEENKACTPPLDEQEVINIARSISERYPKGDGKPLRALYVARQILESNQIITDANGNSFFYNGQWWEPASPRKLERLAKEYDNENHTTKPRCVEIAYFIQQESFQEAISWDNLEIGEIPFKNGIYNFITDVYRAHRPEDYLQRVLPYNHDPLSVCPRWDAYLDTCFENDPEKESKILAIEEYLGYAMLPSAPYKKALVIIGKPDTGKTELQYVFENIVGPINSCAIPLEHLGDPRKLSIIKGKAINIVSELKSNTNVEDAGFKRLISTGEAIQIDRKYHDQEMYTPTCKHIIITNNLPLLHDLSGAIFNRLLIIEFPNRITPEDRDPNIRETLQRETQGIALRALCGLKRLVDNNGQFTIPSSSLEVLSQYRDDSNPLSEFVEICLKPVPGARTPLHMVRNLIKAYYPQNRLTDTKITQILRSMNCEIKKTSHDGLKGTYLLDYELIHQNAFF